MTVRSEWLRPSLRASLRFTALLTAGAVAFVGAGWLGGCGDDTGSGAGTGEGGGVSLEGVVYEGGATDEALEALVATPAKNVATEVAAFSFPTEGATVPAEPAPTFKWAVGGSSSRLLPSELLRAPDGVAPTHEPGWVERLIHAREAHAHGVPISGRAYFLTFSDAAGKPVLRVFTTQLEYTPTAAALATLGTAGSIKAEIVNAIFEENRITTDGGPFTGAPRSFSVTL